MSPFELKFHSSSIVVHRTVVPAQRENANYYNTKRILFVSE